MMTLDKLMSSGLLWKRTMIVVKNYDMYVVAQGSPKAATVQKFADAPLDSFVWEKDGTLIINLSREVEV